LRRSFLAVAFCFVGVLPSFAQTETAANPPPRDEASVGGLLVGLWHDVPRLVLPSNLIILGTGGALALVAENSDAILGASVAGNDELGEWFKNGSYTGNGWIQITGAVGTYVAGRMTGNATARAVGTDLVQAQILNTLLTSGV
jgi:hypothetical protein